MTQIDQIIADALAGSPETHVAILSREVLRLREAPAVVVPDLGEDAAYEACAEWIKRTEKCPSPLEAYIDGWNDRTSRLRPIPADRALGDGMVQVDQKELMALESLFGATGRAIHAASSGRGATLAEINEEWAGVCAAKVLRANQGGA